MQVLLKREDTSDEGTFGYLYINGEYFCRTAELPKDHDYDGETNEKNKECIPEGVYKCILRKPSNKFPYEHYILEDVPNRSFILIHKGNWAGNTSKGYKSDIEGCIILGEDVDQLNGQLAVVQSNSAFQRFMTTTRGKDFILTIE